MSVINTCGIIPPRREDIIGYREDGYLGECIAVENHNGPHVLKTPEGEFIFWKDDWECGCCVFDEDERCTVFGQITNEYIQFFEENGEVPD